MFNLQPYIDLPMVWGGIIIVAVILYVILDGFDLGIGILFPFAPSDDCRSKMMNSIAPFWDGNETWLVLGGGGLFAAFPLAYAVIMSALYVPVLFMLIALVFRGVAFEFRFKSTPKYRIIWDMAFHFGSLFATFMQGVILGGIVQGIKITNLKFTGTGFDWLSAFSLTTGFALVCGYALLGSTWLIMKTSQETQIWAKKTAKYVAIYVIFFMALVSLWTPFLDPEIFQRWFSWPNAVFLMWIPLGVMLAFLGLLHSINSERWDAYPFLLTIMIFLFGFVGLIVGGWPYIVPRSISFYQAAAVAESQSLMLIGVALILPLVLCYTAYSYYVFRGKATKDLLYTT